MPNTLTHEASYTHFRLLNNAFGHLAGLPGPVLGRHFAVKLEWTDRHLVPNCPVEGPGTLGPDFGPPALALRPNRPKTGLGNPACGPVALSKYLQHSLELFFGLWRYASYKFADAQPNMYVASSPSE